MTNIAQQCLTFGIIQAMCPLKIVVVVVVVVMGTGGVMAFL